MAKKVQDWKVYYNNYYKRSYELFIDYFQYVQKAYKNMPLKEKADFWKKYYYFTQKTLRIFTYLFFCNGVCVKNFKITLLYILNFEITQSGQELFYLVNELNSLKNSKFLITDLFRSAFYMPADICRWSYLRSPAAESSCCLDLL